MSGVPAVPETADRNGSVRDTVRRTGVDVLLVRGAQRLRRADGFSHARSLAYVTSLVSVQGLIAVVGIASALDRQGVGRGAQHLVRATAPGPVGDALSTAIEQARATGGAGRAVALTFGLVGSLVTATTGMAELQRSLNRLYGVARDRPTAARYRRAFVLAASAGTVIAVTLALVATGDGLGETVADNVLTPVWGVARVPMAALVLVCAVVVLFRWCPDRRQPGWSWLVPGAGVAVTAWILATVVLSLIFRHSSTFGRAYGSLAGMVALLLWSFVSATALLFGAALGAELEAQRADQAGADPPRIHLPPVPGRDRAPAPLSGTGR